jgi:hypothetical protein
MSLFYILLFVVSVFAANQIAAVNLTEKLTPCFLAILSVFSDTATTIIGSLSHC